MIIKNFEDLEIFKHARNLTKEIYQYTSTGNFFKDYGLKDQIQRASVSVILNLAEGFDSGSSKSFISFLRYSYRSASEVRAILYIALDLNYIDQKAFCNFTDKTIQIQKMISSLIKHIESRKI